MECEQVCTNNYFGDPASSPDPYFCVAAIDCITGDSGIYSTKLCGTCDTTAPLFIDNNNVCKACNPSCATCTST